VCRTCRESAHPADERLGLGQGRTHRAERMLTLAGGSWSFAQASKLLKEFCGLSVSDNTIRKVCQEQATAIAQWRHTEPDAHAKFRKTQGEIEFETDGTSVNTTEGWREMRLALFDKRDAAEPAEPADWDKRKLPKPNVVTAFAAMEKGERFISRWSRWLGRLGIDQKKRLHVVADGAPWIWNGVRDQFKNADGVLDIYHALEHIADAVSAVKGKGTDEAAAWRDTARERLLEAGWSGVRDWLKRERAATRKKAARRAIDELLAYLGRQSEHLDYRRHLAEGRTIGSGLVEGACKQMIGRRLKQTGARWRVRRVNRMATLCCVLHTGDWQTYWNQTLTP